MCVSGILISEQSIMEFTSLLLVVIGAASVWVTASAGCKGICRSSAGVGTEVGVLGSTGLFSSRSIGRVPEVFSCTLLHLSSEPSAAAAVVLTM